MTEIETFGWYQLRIYAIITLPLLLSAGFTLDYVFTAGEVDYRCAIPECENPNATSLRGPAWVKYAQPTEQPKDQKDVEDLRCLRYEVAYGQNLKECTANSFTNRTRRCDSFVYDPDETTILNEFKLPCVKNKIKLTMIGTLNNLGQLTGLSVASQMSDRYGRRTVITMITFLSGISGCIHSFSINYWMFAIFEFIDACFAAGLYSACFIYAMEMTGTKYRIMGSVVISCLYAVGEMCLGVAGMLTREWRILMRVVYGPGIFVILLKYVLPESVRWLQANKQYDKAEKVYRKMAQVNNIVLSEDALAELRAINEDEKKEKEASPDKKVAKASVTQLGQHPIILSRLLISCFCWLTNTFVYYGLSLNSTDFGGGNKYISFILVVAIEIPGNILVYPFLNTFGRRATLCGAFMLSGVFCLLSQFVPAAPGSWIPLIIYVLGKGFITMAFSTSYVYTTEMFPTTLRHSLLGICSMTGRIGSILAPQTPLLKPLYEGLPLILFGSMSLIAGLLSLTFPETLGLKLPDTIAEAECIGKKKSENSPPDEQDHLA